MTPRSTLLGQAARPVYWLMVSGAVWILLRGHNEPGGGFIGALVAVAGSGMLGSVLGTRTARRYQPLAPLPLALVGVLLALLSGLAAPLSGRPFLTHLWSGGLSTVLLFDLGVFLAVWGTLTGYIYALLDGQRRGGP
jgi:multicomponent Na+:H+ antiporter subunit B